MVCDINQMTPDQVRKTAYDAIIREMGVAGFMRFMRENFPGSGDYTRDRHQWLKQYDSVEELAADAHAATEELRRQGLIK